MLARIATVSDTKTIQRSSPRESNSTLIAEISSMARRTWAETAAPARTASAAPAGTYTVRVRPPDPAQHHIGIRPVQLAGRASASLLAATTSLVDHRTRDQPLHIGQRAGQPPSAGPQLPDRHRSGIYLVCHCHTRS